MIMDTSATIVTILLAGSFFGFILWLAIHSRTNTSNRQKSDTGIDLPEAKRKDNTVYTS